MELRLEPLDVRHAAELFHALNHPKIGDYIGGPDVTTLSELADRIHHLQRGPTVESGQRWFNFAVLLNSQIVGRVEATSHDDIAEIAYLINPLLWGQGLGTEAARLLLSELRNVGEKEFWGTCVPENFASARVMERLGFVEIPVNDAPPLLSYDPGDRVFQLKT